MRKLAGQNFPELSGFSAALPDIISSLIFIGCWVSPYAYDSELLKALLVGMFLELFAICLLVFFISTRSFLADSDSKTQIILSLACIFSIFGAIGFGAAVSATYQVWEPFWSFLWLLFSKFFLIVLLGLSSEKDGAPENSIWVTAGAWYVISLIFVLIIPLPRLGITSEVVAILKDTGSGLATEKPHILIAWGALYFALMAWTKLTMKFK